MVCRRCHARARHTSVLVDDILLCTFGVTDIELLESLRTNRQKPSGEVDPCKSVDTQELNLIYKSGIRRDVNGKSPGTDSLIENSSVIWSKGTVQGTRT